MSSDPVFTVRYWGVTGTMADPLRPSQVTDKLVRALEHLAAAGRLADLSPGMGLREAVERAVASLPFHLRSTFGGNTTCAEMRTPDARIILDCGSGYRELGLALEQEWNAPGHTGDRTAHVLVTHPHVDHTLATPFFGPYFDPRNTFLLYGTRTVLDSLEAVLNPQSALSKTYFPPTFDMMPAIKDKRELWPGEEFAIGRTSVRTFALTHPGGCLAYRFDCDGRSFVFATDHEHKEVPDRALADFARSADLLYTEGQYTKAEYEGREAVPGEAPMPRKGWGHSPVESSIATAVAAGVKRLHLGHRDPARSDDDVVRLEEYARAVMRESLRTAGRPEDDCDVRMAYEGLCVCL